MRDLVNSGIDWLGDMPSHWEVYRNKALFSNVSIKNHGDATVLSLYRELGVIPKDSRDDNHNVTSLDTDSYKYVEQGDLVINKMKAWSGSLGISDYEGIVSPAYYVCKVDYSKVAPRFIHHYLRNLGIVEAYEMYSAGMRIGQWDLGIDDFMSIKVGLPPLQEQERIAERIDTETEKVDALIANQQAQIENLKQYKQSLITEVVTKGLDPNAPMKDSGVDVIGEIPKHWNVRKNLFCLEMPITDGPHTTPELYDDGIPFVSAEAVSCGNGSIDFDHIRGYISQEFYEECCLKYIPQRDDIYMIKSGATTGRVSIVDTDRIFTIWSPLAVMRCNKQIMTPKFLFYYLQSVCFQRQVELGWTYGTQQNIGMRTLEKLKVIVPPLDEQVKMIGILDTKCEKIKGLIQIKEQKIAKLTDYKKSVIYEYVTGKKEVGLNE